MISLIIIVKDDLRIQNLLHALQTILLPDTTEIIVVDASKGNLQHIHKQFSNVIWIDFENNTQKQITITEQRNAGIRRAVGDIIVFIDSDCVPKKDWLVEITKPIREESEHIVAGKVLLSEKHSLHTLSQESRTKTDYISEAPTMNLALVKGLFNEVGLFDEHFTCGEDIDFCWRARKAGFKIRFTEWAIIYHDLGSIGHDMRRMYFYGKARTKLYIKHHYQWKLFLHELFYPLYFIFLPVTFVFQPYPLLLLFPLLQYRHQNPWKVILMKTIYGTGFLKALILPE